MCDGAGFCATVAGLSNYVAMPNITELNSAITFSISAWLKKTSTGGTVGLGKIGASGESFYLFFQSTLVRAYFARGGADSYGDATVTDDANLHHFVLVYNGNGATNADKIKIYMDGSALTLTFFGTIPTTSTANTGAFNLLRWSSGVLSGSNGTIAQTDIYTSAISSSDVTTLYNSGAGRTDGRVVSGHLVGWRFREGGTGTTAYAYGNSYSATYSTTYNGTYTGTVTRSAGLIYNNNTPRFSVAVSNLDSEAGTSSVTTSTLYSATVTPGAGVVYDGIAVKIATVATTPTGTLTVTLRNTTDSTNEKTVTVNVSDLQAQNLSSTMPGWAFFKFASSFTTVAAKAYAVGLATSSSSQVTCYTNGTANNWSRMYRTTTTQCPAVGDSIAICGELTGPGTGNDVTITRDNLEQIIWGTANISVYTSVAVSFRGILAGKTSGGRNYWFGVMSYSGYGFQIDAGGTLQDGTSSSRISSDTSSNILLSQTANVDCGIVIRAGGKWVTGADNSKTRVTYLTADISAGATSFTVNDATGWAIGDNIAIPSTTRTYSQYEMRTITGVSGNTITCATITNAHTAISVDGATTRVFNLSSNVNVLGISTTLNGYINFANYFKEIDINGLTCRYLGSATPGKRGIDVQLTGTGTGVANFKQITCYDFTSTSACGLVTSSVYGAAYLKDFIVYNAYQGVSFSSVSTTTYINENIYSIGSTGATGIAISDVGGQWNGTIYASSSASNGINISESAAANYAWGAFESHSCASANITIGAARNLSFSSVTSWRCSAAGVQISASCFGVSFGSVNMFGNTTDNLLISAGTSGVVITGGAMSGDTSFSTTSNIRISTSSCYTNFTFSNVLFSQTSGIRVAATNDINVSVGIHLDLKMTYCSLAAANEIASVANLYPSSVVSSQDHDQTSGNHKFWLPLGIGTRDTAIYSTASESLRLTPSGTAFKSVADSRSAIIASGTTKTVSVKVRLSTSGDGGAYNGAYPRLVLKANRSLGSGWASDSVLATATSSASGAFVTLSGTTPTASQNGAFEVYVDCDGTTGWINVDDWSIA